MYNARAEHEIVGTNDEAWRDRGQLLAGRLSECTLSISQVAGRRLWVI